MDLQQILDRMSIAVATSAALHTGLLAELSKGSATSEELAARLGLDARATSLVLDVLSCEGWVERQGEAFSAGPGLRGLAELPGGYTLGLGMWTHTESFLRTGAPFVEMDLGTKEREAAYQKVVGSLGQMFGPAAEELAGRVPLAPSRILEVGCGSGVWSLAFLTRHPRAEVTGLDLPAVLESFKARAASLGLSDRIHTLPGDMHAVPLENGAYDLVIIANVLRLETPTRAASLIGRLAKAVAPAGSLLVVDALAHGTPQRDRARLLYALHLGLRTREGQVHSPQRIADWLKDAGLPRIQAVDVAAQAGGVGALLASRG